MKFLYAILLTTLLCFTQDDKKDQIQWSATYKLQWTDFMGSPAGSLKAMTWSTIALETKKIDANSITLNMNAFFIKSQSWRQKNFTDDFVLGHEQTHFNIAEVYTRKLRKKISQTKYSNTKKAMQEIQKTYNETFAELKAYQKNTMKKPNTPLIKTSK